MNHARAHVCMNEGIRFYSIHISLAKNDFLDNLVCEIYKNAHIRLAKTIQNFNFATVSSQKILGTIHLLYIYFFILPNREADRIKKKVTS